MVLDFQRNSLLRIDTVNALSCELGISVEVIQGRFVDFLRLGAWEIFSSSSSMEIKPNSDKIKQAAEWFRTHGAI